MSVYWHFILGVLWLSFSVHNQYVKGHTWTGELQNDQEIQIDMLNR